MFEFSFWYVVFVCVEYGLCECFVGSVYVRYVVSFCQCVFNVFGEAVPVRFFVVCVAVSVLRLSEVGSGTVGNFDGEVVRVYLLSCPG